MPNSDVDTSNRWWKSWKTWAVIGVCIFVVVVIAVLVYVLVYRKNGGESKENFVSTDAFNEQGDYASSYIMSVLGGNVI